MKSVNFVHKVYENYAKIIMKISQLFSLSRHHRCASWPIVTRCH